MSKKILDVLEKLDKARESKENHKLRVYMTRYFYSQCLSEMGFRLEPFEFELSMEKSINGVEVWIVHSPLQEKNHEPFIVAEI